ncbi:MAG: Asp-tRNA(Asn)/Glu-tRNA(Gln) amidotransferase A subunit family amidase [Gammaproteobacteria bacterium]|jgi:Asp-tRNA(Asn)/Glu-tRNA(Gln) amidotransferase A subunit family amidase
MTAEFEEYEDDDAMGLADLVARGEVYVLEVPDAVIACAEARNPAVNAMVHNLYDHGREQVAAGLPAGSFKGVLFLLKDLGSALAGTRTATGSHYFAKWSTMRADSPHVAVQAVARFADETILFRLAFPLELAWPWIARKPALVKS